MKRLLIVLCVVALLAACEQQQQETAGEGFSLSGRVVKVDEGAEPEGLPDPADVGDEEPPGGEPEGEAPDDAGGIAVRPDDVPSELEGCPQQHGTLTVFYTDDTQFIPSDVVRDDSFPDNLRNATVEVTGTLYTADLEEAPEEEDAGASPEAGCALVAQSIGVEDLEGGEPATRETPTPGPRSPSPGAGTSPEASPLETSEATSSP